MEIRTASLDPEIHLRNGAVWAFKRAERSLTMHRRTLKITALHLRTGALNAQDGLLGAQVGTRGVESGRLRHMKLSNLVNEWYYLDDQGEPWHITGNFHHPQTAVVQIRGSI